MKERSLHALSSRLVILAVPLATQAGCGGTASVDDGAADVGSASDISAGPDPALQKQY